MNKKLIISIVVLIILIPMLIIGSGINCFLQSRKQIIVVSLKNGVDIETSKHSISKISHVKKITIIYKDKEWAKISKEMGNIPNMENPLKNQLLIKTDNQKNIEKVKSQLKEKSFVEDIGYASDTECALKIFKWIFKKDF